MAQKIKQGNIFGRIGTGIGRGLSEQIPKEIENYRLKSGLNELANEADQGNLSPAQYLAKASGTYGITPQMVQSFGELAKIQNQGNAYKKSGMNPYGVPEDEPNTQNIKNINFANIAPQVSQNPNMPAEFGKLPPVGAVNNLQQTPNISPNENVPQVVQGNQFNEKNLTRSPWTSQKRHQTTSNYIKQGFLPEQARQLTQDDEASDLAEPEAYKKRLEDIEFAKEKVRDTLKRHLETKLQKTGEDVYKDVEGNMILNAERGMTRDLIKNPYEDIDNVANDWSERLFRTAIAKDKLRKLGNTTGLESFFKGEQNLKKLKEYQDIFKKSGNLEEFQNMLIGPDFRMSPQAAASVAYPPNEKIKKFVGSYKTKTPTLSSSVKVQEAKKAALELEDLIGPDDSVLSIMKNLSDRDPFFDQQAFLDQIAEDKDQIGLNDRQRLELGEGPRNILPNWADLLYLPIIGR